jgi:hypothetical protein
VTDLHWLPTIPDWRARVRALGSDPATTDPRQHAACAETVFANPDLVSQFDPEQLASLRRRRNALSAWSIGRELIRHGNHREGRIWLRCSFRVAPGVRQAAIYPRYGPFGNPSAGSMSLDLSALRENIDAARP